MDRVLLASESQLPAAILTRMYAVLEEHLSSAALPEQTRVGLIQLAVAVLHTAAARNVSLTPAPAVVQVCVVFAIPFFFSFSFLFFLAFSFVFLYLVLAPCMRVLAPCMRVCFFHLLFLSCCRFFFFFFSFLLFISFLTIDLVSLTPFF